MHPPPFIFRHSKPKPPPQDDSSSSPSASTSPSSIPSSSLPPRHKKTYDPKQQMKQIAAGAVSSIVTRVTIQPFEVLKMRFQLQVESPDFGHGDAKYKSFLQACGLIYREEGISAFMKGHNAAQVLSLVYGASQFWAYEQIKLFLDQPGLLENRRKLNQFVSGALSGGFATTTAMPFDVVRTRFAVQDPGSGYRNAITALPTIIKEEGFRGLYRGWVPSMVQVAPLVGLNFAFFEIFTDFSTKVFNVEKRSLLPTWVFLFNGAMTGTLSKVTLLPLDFIKRRLQVQGFHEHRQTFGKNQICESMTECIRLTIRDEGVLGFYKGMTPTLLKAAVSTAFYFTVYEKMKGRIIR